MNVTIKGLLFTVAATALLQAPELQARATAEEIARLGKDLTCVGAERAGNADGSIPEWSGKWLGVPPHVDFKGTGSHPIDPYADDKPLFVITAENMAQYADRLSRL